MCDILNSSIALSFCVCVQYQPLTTLQLIVNLYGKQVPDLLTGQHFLSPLVSVESENLADLTVVLVNE